MLPVIQLLRRLSQHHFFSLLQQSLTDLLFKKKLPEIDVRLKLLLNSDGMDVHTINFENYSLLSKATILKKNATYIPGKQN